MGAISLAGREHLDNLVFVINCNLQRLDGPVRGNGKIIQELETNFRGAGWNVIKVIWGSRWDPLLAADHDGVLAAADGGGARRRLPDLQVARRRLRARALLRHRRRSSRRWSRTGPTTRSGRSTAAATTRSRSTPPTPRRSTHTGPADGDPRQDDQGLRDGGVRRGPEHHPPAEEDDRGRAAGVPRPLRPAAHRRAGPRQARSSSRPTTPEMRLPARAPRGARRLAARARRRRAESLPVPELEALQVGARRHGRARDLDDDGLRPRPRRAAARQGARPAHRADRRRRVAHVRHGGHVPPARDLQPGRPALPRPRTPTQLMFYKEDQQRPDPPGGHQRGRAR